MTSSATPARNSPNGGPGHAGLAGGQRAVAQALDEHDDQRDADDDGGGLHDPVDPPVPEDPDHHRGDDQDQDPLRDGQRGGDAVHGLGLDDQLGGDEPDVEQQHGGEHERGPVEPELAPALDRLRYPQPGSLGGVQRDQQRPDQGPGGDGDQRPPERQPDRDGDRAEDDVEDVDVAAEPERELVPRACRAGLRPGCGRCAGSPRTGGVARSAPMIRPSVIVLPGRNACWWGRGCWS